MHYIAMLIYGLIGFSVGLIAPMAGVGGGVFLVPLLIITNYAVDKSIATSKLVVLAISIIAALNYYKAKKIRFDIAVPMLISMFIGSYIGANLIIILNKLVLELMLGSFLTSYSIYALVKTIKNWHVNMQNNSNGIYGLNYKQLIHVIGTTNSKMLTSMSALGLIVGIIAGITGTGGGTMLVPIYHELFSLSIHEAIASSYITILVGAIASSINHIIYNQVDALVVASIIPGGVIGSWIGSHIALRIKPKILKIIVALIILYSGTRILSTIL
jgi:uncharacterized membrane protein YfcA